MYPCNVYSYEKKTKKKSVKSVFQIFFTRLLEFKELFKSNRFFGPFKIY